MAGYESLNGFTVGDKVKCSAEYDVNGTHLASFVRENTYEIIQIGGRNLPDDRVVIGINGKVTAAVKMSELTNISNTATPMPDPEPVLPPEEPQLPPAPTPEIDTQTLVDQLLKDNEKDLEIDLTTGDGTVMLPPDEGSIKRGTATGMSDHNYPWNSVNWGNPNVMTADELVKLDQRHASYVQNKTGFPRQKEFDKAAGYYRYDYYMDYEKDKMMGGLHVNTDNAIRKAINIDVMSRGDLIQKYVTRYNKFKLMNANDVLMHSYAHVFFVRPDCNILKDDAIELADRVDGYSEFYYALKQAPFLLRELTQANAKYNHELALYLSNKARSFEVSDEYINSATYGESLTGFKIPYGKSNVESQGAGKFSISYHDDRDLHIYHLHRLWTNYISYVYRGKLNPKDNYIINKVLDYPTCVYYILTAEDGETIIFWSKYWGVFPLEAPSSGFSYNIDNAGGVSNPELKVEYQFAWKEDFNPLSLIEFNKHTKKLGFYYVPNYQEIKAGTGYTWGGPPFVETLTDPNGLDLPYTFKLRFRKG